MANFSGYFKPLQKIPQDYNFFCISMEVVAKDSIYQEWVSEICYKMLPKTEQGWCKMADICTKD